MKKVLIIIGAIVLGFVVLGVIIFAVVSFTSHKLECTSPIGDITIMYNDDTITGYTANGMAYEMDTQQQYAESVGVEAYLNEFVDWFEENTNGVCKR